MAQSKKFLFLALVSAILFCGCLEDKSCKAPNAIIGSKCCLDANDNSVCDAEEPPTTTTTTSTTSTSTTTTTSTTSTTTTKPTTTSTTTTSTTSTTKSPCGERSCVEQFSTGECKQYGTINYVCLNQTSMLECNTNTTLKCSAGYTCIMTQTGGHCTSANGKSVPSKMYLGGR